MTKTETVKPRRSEAMRNKCFDCCGDMLDGRVDCEVVTCSLYYWQPYRKLEPDLGWRETGSHLQKNRKALREKYRGKDAGEVPDIDDADDTDMEDSDDE